MDDYDDLPDLAERLYPESPEETHTPTRGERREQQRERQQRGMVRHSPPNVRPKDFLKVRKP